MKVYLAGKISRDDWRTNLDGYRAFSLDAYDVADDNEENENAKLFETYFGELPVISKHPYIKVTGPFFLSCDHGCYHGNGTHGVGAVQMKKTVFRDLFGPECGCAGETFSQSEVARICMNQIRRADMVFAYINCADCFGTLLEIGYAIGIGKPVVTLFKSKALANDMWFVRENSNAVFTISDKSYALNGKTYVDEAVWIANRVARGETGQALWYFCGDGITEEEGKFCADYCHLSAKDKYVEYLKTAWWQKIRLERLKIDGYKCVNCGTEKNIQVHHTDYSNGWFHEDPRQDLVTLCKKCHEEKVHGQV